MSPSLEFILGLLDADFPAHASQEDFAGQHCEMLRLWQWMGFLAEEPGQHPVPSCPHCREGMPHLLGGRYICDACQSKVDCKHLLLWRFDLEAFLTWLARALRLDGGVRPVSERLWQLGSHGKGEYRSECFFRQSGPIGERGLKRLLAYHNVVLFQGGREADPIEGVEGSYLSLLDLLHRERGELRVADVALLLRRRGTVRFDKASGVLRVGNTWLGEVPVGSKEYHFLACLARHLDQFVPYADIKRHVLRHAGSTDTTEEATFAQKLKRRLKEKWVPQIDLLIAKTNKGDGYRLRGSVEPWRWGTTGGRMPNRKRD